MVIAPRYRSAPRTRAGRGGEAVELAESAGLVLDEWQKLCLVEGLRTRRGRWASFEVGVNVARQNGKGALLEARELAGLFCFGERLIIHSAHQFDTSLEAFRRLLWRIEDTPGLDCQVKRVSRSHGEEGIELRSGQRIRFRTRTKGGGRGFSADCLILDEAMFLPEMAHGALLPTLSARSNPQVWYTGSAVDQLVHENGIVFARVRDRGMRRDAGLAYLEWSAHGELEQVLDYLDDRAEWRNANPALGIRITEEHVSHERASMDSRTFAVERLGLGDWPSTDVTSIVDFEKWQALVDAGSVIDGPACLAFDVTPDRGRAAVSVSGRRPDGLLHVETAEYQLGTGWLPEAVAQICARNDVVSVSCDSASPAAALVRPLENLGVTVATLGTLEYARACGNLFDLIEQAGLRHLGSPELSIAVRNAATRPLGDAWAWARKQSATDISPLVAATLAAWQASQTLGSIYDTRGLIAV